MSCKTPGCLDVMTCQRAQQEAVAEAEASTVAAIVKQVRSYALDFDSSTHAVISTLADEIERKFSRPGEGGQKPRGAQRGGRGVRGNQLRLPGRLAA